MEATVVGRVRSRGTIPTRSGLRIFQAVLQDGTGMVTASWPGQPWLDRRIQDGDLILATGTVRFFHGRQLQPREFVVLARASEGGRRRLAWDELFFLQLVQARSRWEQGLAKPGIAHRRTNELIRSLLESLPFQLTEAQSRVLREIVGDMTSARRMSRLLQGDV